MLDTIARERSTAAYAHGALCGLAAVSIWAGNIIVGSLGLRSSLTAWDITAIRFAVAGLLLAPLLARSGLALDRLGWLGVAALILGGAPTVLLASAGLLFAPAAHAGALFPGVMPLMTAILAALVLNESFTLQKRIGLRSHCQRRRGHCLGGRHHFRHAADDRAPAVSRVRAGVRLLHGRFAPGPPRRSSCSSHLCRRLDASLSSALHADGRT